MEFVGFRKIVTHPIHKINLHTTDGGVQSPPPLAPFRGGGPFADAKVVITLA